jgi:hypothetical protein
MIEISLPRLKPGKPPTALVAWEVGAGFTHTRNILGVVQHLRRAGWACVVASADPRFDARFRPLGVEVIQTVLWPNMRSTAELPDPRPARTLSDVLVNFGLTRKSVLAGAIAHYEALFKLLQPDVVICENAFGALLAGRGRIPTIVFGSTLLMIPSVEGTGFAAIDPNEAEASWSYDDVVQQINDALATSGALPLGQVADILACDAMLPFGPAAFDPYLGRRSTPVLSPYCPDLPGVTAAGPGTRTYVYLHDSAQRSSAVLDALVGLKGQARIFIPDIRDEVATRLSRAGHIVATEMLSLAETAAGANLLIHQGGVTLTAAALALGVPQLILARFRENAIAGRYVEEQGLGRVWRIDKIDAATIIDAAGAMRSDARLLQRARQRAPEFRAWFGPDPTELVARAAIDIYAGGGAPHPQHHA